LWEAGCSVRIIYSIANRAVLEVLRSHQGRGPVPMKQSVITDSGGTITKYNHSKWIQVTGHWGASRGQFVTFTGSANWSDLAPTDDEQMQRFVDRTVALRYLTAFTRTWRQRSSHHPGFGTMPVVGGRVVPTFAPDVPLRAPAWGRGAFRYMTPD
jgi:phosphatidylserine/phosphatidylglycerophosphate/cardiolipin synthase-like enzyme